MLGPVVDFLVFGVTLPAKRGSLVPYNPVKASTSENERCVSIRYHT